MTLKEDERRGRAAVPNTFPACEQICPRGGRQLTNYVRAKRLAFGPGYHLCRQTLFNRNMEKQRGEASVSRRAPPPESRDETTLSPPPRGVRRCSRFKFPPRASPGGGGGGRRGGEDVVAARLGPYGSPSSPPVHCHRWLSLSERPHSAPGHWETPPTGRLSLCWHFCLFFHVFSSCFFPLCIVPETQVFFI